MQINDKVIINSKGSAFHGQKGIITRLINNLVLVRLKSGGELAFTNYEVTVETEQQEQQ